MVQYLKFKENNGSDGYTTKDRQKKEWNLLFINVLTATWREATYVALVEEQNLEDNKWQSCVYCSLLKILFSRELKAQYKQKNSHDFNYIETQTEVQRKEDI